MSFIPDDIHRWLQVIAAFIILTLAYTTICSTVGFVVEIEMIASGFNRYFSLGVAVLSAIGCNFFIVFNHKLRNFIKNNRGVSNE